MGQSLNPNLSLTLSTQGRRALREREGLRGYYDDPAGNCSFGIGNLAHFGHCSEEEAQRSLTPDQIEAAFDLAVRSAERAVQRQVSHQPLSQAQFDALVSYTFNMGPGGAMMVLRRIDAGDLYGAADAMLRNINARIGGQLVPLAGLVARRKEESAPFRA